MTEQLPEISGAVLYIYFRGGGGEHCSIVATPHWQTVGDDLYLMGRWPEDPLISGGFAGKSVMIRFDAVESMIQYDSEDEVYEKVFAPSRDSNWRSPVRALAVPLSIVGVGVVFAHYLGKVPDEFAWVGWALGMVGWLLQRQR